MKSISFAALLMMGAAVVPFGAKADEVLVGMDKNVNMEISIYNNNLAFVKDTRQVDLKQGNNLVAFEGVARDMRPETVNITAQGIHVLEQNYDYNLMNYINILEQYVGKEVKTALFNQQTGQTIYDKAKVIDSNYGSPILQFGHGIEAQFPGRIIFEHMPENLRNKPTLVANIHSNQTALRKIEMAYLTNNISWKANYIADISGENILNLRGWVTLNNNSGADYEDAAINLIAGNVNKVYDQNMPIQPRAVMAKGMLMETASMDMAAMEPQREALGDYHLYSLPQKTTIRDKQSKQVVLLSKDNVKFEKIYRIQSPLYVYFQSRENDFKKANPSVIFKLNNTKENGLGEPLPQGTVRFFDRDSRGSSQFIGEASLNQLAVGEKTELVLGQAFDIFASGKSTSSRKIAENIYEADFEIIINNSKDVDQKVEFMQTFSNSWEILSESIKSEKENSSTAKWVVDVPAGGKTVLTFKVRLNNR